MNIEETLRQIVREAQEPLRLELAELRASLKTALAASGAGGDRLLSPSEAHAVTGYSGETVKRWVRQGKLRRHGTPRGLRVSERELRELLAKGQCETSASAAPTDAQILELARKKAMRG